MRLKYTTLSQDELDSLPWLPVALRYNQSELNTSGLVDSGATVNVLPYDIGVRLGATWDTRKAILRLAGSLAHDVAMPLALVVSVGDFTPVRLAFAWTRRSDVPLIFGQTNFFARFDVCFFRAEGEFEVTLKSDG
jgi:hypothetical protein